MAETGKELGLVMIDYLQLMEGSTPDNRVQELSRITRGLKGMARELNVPVMALSQLSRGVEARTNKRRYWAAAIAFEGKLYICGGYRNQSIEVFDPAVGTWQLEGEEMTKARYCFSLFVFEDEIYAVGGDYGGQSTTIEKRNKDTKRWELVADCGQDRQDCAAVLVGSKILLFGGQDHKSTFDFFDLHTKKWASQDQGGAYFDEPKAKQDEAEDEPVSKRQLPRQVYASKAVLITPAVAEKKEWTNLNVVKLEDRDTVRFDERFEATTGKAIAIPNPWDA